MGAFERRWDDDDSTQGRGARVSPLAEGGATHRAVTTYCSHTPLSPRFWLWSDLNDLCQRGARDVGRNLASPLQRATTFRCTYYPACSYVLIMVEAVAWSVKHSKSQKLLL